MSKKLLGLYYENIKRLRSLKICLHSDAPRGCAGKNRAIAAHSISNKASLSAIANNGTVGILDGAPDRRDPDGMPVLRSVGVNNATVFSGFCSHHDRTTFAPLDNPFLRMSDEVAFLACYRALSMALYSKQAAINAINARAPELTDRLRLGPDGDALIEGMLHGSRKALKELRAHKALADAALDVRSVC